MIYVVSDIHGRCDKYMKLLEKIQFSEKDKLYVLGDVIDRDQAVFRFYWIWQSVSMSIV